ncbi:MAG: leucine-rich repeat domain-containing protein [Clostridia bacterium]|nr:leucine-rich repeat domain-containing protein [Clostridia bacterium]
MKKTLIRIGVICLIILSLALLFSCKDTATKPSNFRLDTDTITLKWDKVAGASSYEIRISGEERTKTTRANYVSLEYLPAGSYTIEVRAKSRNDDVEPSAWASYPFKREEESGLKYKLINNRTEYQLIGAGSAAGDVVMKPTYRGKPVTSIADEALYGNDTITSLVIGDFVTEIGKSAFANSKLLTSVELPKGLKSIGEYAFQSCKQLKTISIPGSVEALPDYLFSWCSGLETVTLGEGIVTIGEYTFSNCQELESAKIPDTVTHIGEYAFSDCKSLTKIELGKNVSVLYDFAFANCTAATEIDFGESLTDIGNAAFTGCSLLTELILPETVETIGIEAFYGCSEVSKVEIRDRVRKIGSAAFEGTAIYEAAEGNFSLGYYLDEEKTQWVGWLIEAKNKDITAAALPRGTYGIADNAFSECQRLSSVTVSGVKYVGDYAFAACNTLFEIVFSSSLIEVGQYSFAYCPYLQTVRLGSSLTKIGDYAFLDCSALFKMELPDTLHTVGAYAFHGTSAHNSAADVVYIDDWAVGTKATVFRGITVKPGTRGIADYCFYTGTVIGGIQLPDTVEYVGYAAFYFQMLATEINIPKNLKYIGDYAFYGCTTAWFGEGGITVLPEGLEYIGRSAFYHCSAMVGLTVPGTVKTIGAYAFSGCENLGESSIIMQDDPTETPLVGEVIIGEGVEFIGDRAFQKCIRLAEITIPNSVKTLGARAFYGCTNLKSITVGGGLTEIPSHAFYGCSALRELTISPGVKVIGNYAFRGCESLTSLKLASGITSIGKYAFYGCASLTELVIPRSVVSIGDYAFRGGAKIESVILPSSVTEIGKHAFYSMSTATIFAEAEEIMPDWHERFNSSHRALILGATLSEDGDYVVSFTKSESTLSNATAPGATFSPYHEGYEFLGWATVANSDEVAYTADNLSDAPDGTTLYAVYRELTTTD